MGEKATLTKARQQLEELYLGVPDDSVDLTFKDLASFQQNEVAERKISNMEPIREENNKDAKMDDTTGFGKSPSLDFTKGLQGAKDQHRHIEDELYREHMVRNSFRRNSHAGLRIMAETRQLHHDDDVSALASPFEERGGRRRPGIPHSNICTLCSVYIYFFRHRCLVCGRVYCRSCVSMGMGEMTEGRKCTECLGRRFSQRYIERAGRTGCCWGYPSMVKQQELIWAEKGPRRSGERGYRSILTSRSRSPVMPRTPTRSHASRSRSPVMRGTPSRSNASRSRSPVVPGSPIRSHFSNGPASFVASSTFSHSPHAFPL